MELGNIRQDPEQYHSLLATFVCVCVCVCVYTLNGT